MKVDPVLTIVIVALVGLFAKIVWDWLSNGRVERGIYVTSNHCEALRIGCCLPKVKKEVGVLVSRVKSTEKQLDQSREDFKLLREDNSEIKERLAAIETTLKNLIK